MKITCFIILFIITTVSAYCRETPPEEFALNHFRDENIHANVWHYSWITVYGGSGMYYGYMASESSKYRVTNSVIAAKSILGSAALIFNPSPGLNASVKIENAINSDSETDVYSMCRNLLNSSSKYAIKMNSIKQRTMTFMTNLAGSGIIYLFENDDREKNAIISFAVGMITSEIQIWTAPSGSVDAYRRFNEVYGNSYNNWFLNYGVNTVAMGFRF